MARPLVMGAPAPIQFADCTLGELGKKKVSALAAALGLSDEHCSHALRVFELMSSSWSDWAVGDAPAWPNDISDDGTPFEFSASFDGGVPRLRMLVESQTAPISRTSSWAAGLQLGQRLHALGLVDLSMFERVQGLFAPQAAQPARFSLWHAAVVQLDGPALFKAYLNPCLFGAQSAPYVVEQALRRLGFEDAWDFLEERLAASPGVEVRYFSVDLEAPDHARVKVYLGCSQSAKVVERLIAPAGNSEPHDAEHWLETLTASQGPFSARPILSCFSFRRGSASPDVTVHVPIRCHVKHDEEALSRVARVLTPPDAARLARALSAVSGRPLNVGRGLLTYASLRREAGVVRATVYLAPEAYAISSRRPTMPPPGLTSGVHKASTAVTSAGNTDGDVAALIAEQQAELIKSPLFMHLASLGTLMQAGTLASHLSLLQVCLDDLLRFAQLHAIDSTLRAWFSQQAQASSARSRIFQAMTEALGIAKSAFFPLSSDHGVLREVAYARVADVITAKDDSLRLAVVLSMLSASEQLLCAGFQFFTRLVPGEAPNHSMELPSGRLPLWVKDDASDHLRVAVNQCFESIVRVCDAIDRATFRA